MNLRTLYHKTLGYSLMEILIIIAIISVFSAGFISFFMGLLSTERKARFTLKSEADISALRSYLKKELQGIGFGISADYLRTSPGSCSNYAVISGNSTSLCYLSLASRQTRWAGCWWIVDSSGALFTNSSTRFGGPCIAPSNRYCLFLDYNRITQGIDSCGDTSNFPSTVAFYLDDSNYPANFLVKINLSNNSTPDQSCHPDLQKRTLQIETMDNAQPLISCVYDFRLRYLDAQGNPLTSPPTLLSDISGIRICMIVQAGGGGVGIRFQQSLQYSDRCGGERVNFPNESYHSYPFRIIEEEVSLPNLKGWSM